MINSTTQRSWRQRAFYSLVQALSRLAALALLGIRMKGRRHIPGEGPVIICSNHQSFFDPVLISLGVDRNLSPLARRSLFRWRPFRWVIDYLGAIPINREGVGLGGLKEMIRRLRRGEIVLIFPEGTRTHDGNVQPLKPGLIAVARRSHAPLLPVAIDGAFEAWPRSRKLPRPARVHVVFGEPISPTQVAGMTDDELLAELENRIRRCYAIAREGRRYGGLVQSA